MRMLRRSHNSAGKRTYVFQRTNTAHGKHASGFFFFNERRTPPKQRNTYARSLSSKYNRQIPAFMMHTYKPGRFTLNGAMEVWNTLTVLGKNCIAARGSSFFDTWRKNECFQKDSTGMPAAETAVRNAATVRSSYQDRGRSCFIKALCTRRAKTVRRTLFCLTTAHAPKVLTTVE